MSLNTLLSNIAVIYNYDIDPTAIYRPCQDVMMTIFCLFRRDEKILK